MLKNPFWCGKGHQHEPERERPLPNLLTLVPVLHRDLKVRAEGWESLSGPLASAPTSKNGQNVVNAGPRN